METARITISGRDNLYRWEGSYANGWPRRVEAFELDPEARRILGRWAPCPNANVHARIARR